MSAAHIATSTAHLCCVCTQALNQGPSEGVCRCQTCGREAHLRCIENFQEMESNGEWRCNICNSQNHKTMQKCLICSKPTLQQVSITLTNSTAVKGMGIQQLLTDLPLPDETMTIYGHQNCLINQGSSTFTFNNITGNYQIPKETYLSMFKQENKVQISSPQRIMQENISNLSAHTEDQSAKSQALNYYQPQLNTIASQQNQYKPANLQSLLARHPKNLQNQQSSTVQNLGQQISVFDPQTVQSQFQYQFQHSQNQQNQQQAYQNQIIHQQQNQISNNNIQSETLNLTNQQYQYQFQQQQYPQQDQQDLIKNQSETLTDYFQRRDITNQSAQAKGGELHQHHSASLISSTGNLPFNQSAPVKPQQNVMKIKLDFHTDKVLGKRQRSAGENELLKNGLTKEQREELKHDLDMLKQETQSIDEPMSAKDSINQRDSRDKKSKTIESSPGQSSEMTKNKMLKALDADPSQFVVKEVLTPILFQIDRLQFMRRDKQKFEIMLLNKDLKLLSKERREEILNATSYLDLIEKSDQKVDDLILVIDQNLPQKLIDSTRTSSNQTEQDQTGLPRDSTDNNVQQAQSRQDSEQLSNPDKSQIESPDNEKMEVDEDEESQDINIKDSNMFEEEGFNIKGTTEDQTKSNQDSGNRRKKKKKGYGNNTKSKNLSKALLNLPSNLSDFTWIENTQTNRILLEEERQKQIELKKQKELSKKSKIQELSESDPSADFSIKVQKITEEIKQVSNDFLPNESIQIKEDIEMIDTSTNKPDTSTNLPPMSPQVTTQAAEQKPYEFRSRQNLESVDDIWERTEDGFYHSLDELLKDIEILVKFIMKKRCQNLISKVYLSFMLQRVSQHIKSKKEEFKFRWRNYYEAKYVQNDLYYPRIKGQWWKSPGAKREYNLIENYKIVTPTEPSNKYLQGSQVYKQEIERKMQTTKQSQCDGTCCLKIEDLGPFKLGSDVWESKCPCRLARVECSQDCQCDPNTCQNRQMSLNQALKLDQDVIEKISWGIDMGTAVNLMTLLPKDMPMKAQSDFIEKRLVFAIQQQGEKGYDVREALKFIINDVENPRFRQQDRELAQIVLSGIKMIKDNVERHFRVHSKGIGIFCKRKEGIKASNLIIEYFGEIYQPWNWYEKQDVLKQGQNKQTLSKDLPDFYNITFERHPDDPQGYDILMVDPILYGNYSSRLSHSCNPNCSTIIHVRQGQYSIGMFAIKDINYGEELCFNYCSLTESEKEYESAICLCGTEVCQGRYLQLANDKKHMAIMKKYHTFVDRNYLLYKACKYPEITPEDDKRLQEFGLKDSVMKDVPDWLKKWASLICEYIIFEEEIYPSFFKELHPTYKEEDLKIEAKNQRDSKIWNIAITIDKVMHVLKSMGVMEAPIKDLSYKEKCIRLWDSQGSLREGLIEVLNQVENYPEKLEALQKVLSVQMVNVQIEEDENGRYFKDKFEEIQSTIALISGIIRPIKSTKVMIPALCDMLWLYANTHTYFTPNENYKKCKGDEQKIRKCDVRIENQNQASLNPVEQEKQVYRGFKEYDPSYVWGQLVGWFKQTVDKPNASLSADRRGTLSMPDLESFIVSAKNQENLKSGIKRKKTKKGGSDDEQIEEILPTKKQGTKSRPLAHQQSMNQLSNQDSISLLSDPVGSAALRSSSYKDPKMIYPHKKHQTRQAFLENWPENFSKQWDVVCHWSFKNRNRMYGSVQFESILQADTDRQRRLYYFQNVLNYLRNQQ